MTGFSQQARKVIHQRGQGRCERCTRFSFALEIHHRRPRAMGGSKDWLTNTPANGVLLCPDCHRFIESFREKALEFGWLVRQGHDPRDVPVYYHGVTWVKLDLDGGITHLPPGSDHPDPVHPVGRAG
ncbi:hypothetical protein MPHLEI_22459 [Mycolicibacterium phlei RIVM601174]|nr:hypothetical protein MPHLEI_22459 [Mycolicibacterium phlei RIVM601174]MBF4194580.1 hypothetical protein [Mycolicibacterium phlei]